MQFYADFIFTANVGGHEYYHYGIQARDFSEAVAIAKGWCAGAQTFTGKRVGVAGLSTTKVRGRKYMDLFEGVE